MAEPNQAVRRADAGVRPTVTCIELLSFPGLLCDDAAGYARASVAGRIRLHVIRGSVND
jgi:hypothetical protein